MEASGLLYAVRRRQQVRVAGLLAQKSDERCRVLQGAALAALDVDDFAVPVSNNLRCFRDFTPEPDQKGCILSWGIYIVSPLLPDWG